MIQFVNKRSGLIFLVADERKDEYLAAGHKLAAEFYAKEPKEKAVEEPKKVDEKPKKAVKKATKAKK